MSTTKRVPASIRNFNPGAQYPGKVSKKFGSTSHQVLKSKDGTHKIATFPNHIQGAAAMFYLLASNAYADGKRTIRQAITKWCGGFYVTSYISVLESKAGVSRDTILTRALVCNPEVAIPLAKAMAWQEAGQDYPLSDAEWAQAHALALPDAVRQAAPIDVPTAGPPPATDVEGYDRAARSKPEERVQDVATTSWTIKGALASVMLTVWNWVEWGYGYLASAFEMAQSAVGASTPLGLFASAAMTSTSALIGLLTIGALLLIIARRLTDAEEGKTR